jgi:hypothetical protein
MRRDSRDFSHLVQKSAPHLAIVPAAHCRHMLPENITE